MTWFVYILECADGSLYTGITTDVGRRLKEHNTNDELCSKFIRSRRPVRLAYSETHTTKSSALKREWDIKRWNRQRKIKLVEGSE